jgi:hypothetical protein
MEFHKIGRFNAYLFCPDNDDINGCLLAAFDATGIAGGNFKIICEATSLKSLFLNAQLYLQSQLAANDFIIDVQPEEASHVTFCPRFGKF